MEPSRERKRTWKIDENWDQVQQSISVCTCVTMNSHHCTRCTDTFSSYLEYVTHTCTPKMLYQCCDCIHLYVNCDEFQSHECTSCQASSVSTGDNGPVETSHGEEFGLSAEIVEHTNTPSIFIASSQQNSDGILQKVKKEERADSPQSLDGEVDMEGNTSMNDSMTDVSVDNDCALHVRDPGNVSDSQKQQRSSSESEDTFDSQEQVMGETRVLQGKNKTGQKSSSATREKRVTGTKVRKRNWGRDRRAIKKEMVVLSKVILNQIAGVEGKGKMTRGSLVEKVVESELQRILSTSAQVNRKSKLKKDGEKIEVIKTCNPERESEGDMDNSVKLSSERDITKLGKNSILTMSSEEVPNSQSEPHSEVPEVPLIESNEKEVSSDDKAMHSKHSRSTAGNGHSEANLVFKKLGVSTFPNSGKEYKIYKLVTSDSSKEVKSNSSLIHSRKSKPVESTPPKGIKDNRSLIKLLSSPPTNYTNQHALQTSLLPCNNVFSPLPNSHVPNSPQIELNPDSLSRNFTSVTALSTGTNDPVRTSQQEDSTDSQFSEEDLNASIVKSEPMDESVVKSEPMDESGVKSDPMDESDISMYHSEHMYDDPHTPDIEKEPIITTFKSEPMDEDSLNIPQTQDTDIEHSVEGQNTIIKSEPVDDSYNFSACYSENLNDIPHTQVTEESINFTNIKNEPEEDSSDLSIYPSQNQHDIPNSQVTEEENEEFITVKNEPLDDSSELSAYYFENQNDNLHSQVTEENENLLNVNSGLENSSLPPELLYVKKEMEKNLQSAKMSGSDTGQFWLYNCKTCGKKFKHAGTLMVHERAHNLEKKEHQCFICGRICTAASYLKVHLRTHKEEPTDLRQRKIECFKCDERFLHEENFQTHMRMHFQKGLTYCLKCGKGFYRKAQLDRHMESHAGKFPCKQCGREFSSQAGRTIHLNSHKEKQTNSTEKFPCEECGKEFSTSIGRTVHLNIHNKHKQTINCPICDRVFKKNLSIYEDHLREHELATLFICPVCGHGFSSKVELSCHQKKHLEKMEGASSHVLSAVRGLVNQRR